ncbi:MAG TPA: aminopeptidase [Steroidobacteraceae bacterium]
MLTESPTRPARAFRFILSLLLCGELTGCSVTYLMQATQGQWRLMRARRPIDRVLADPTQSPQLKSRLELVRDARDFASRELALPDNQSYRSYADLRRAYVVWNVVAAPEFSIKPLHWCFPFVGCLSYRGYFHERSARAFASRLAARGDDTLVSGVTAYSTLGHFADPVLNTMMRYGDLDLVATIFHELAHQLLYVKGDTAFNESFAMTVEQEGLRRWLAARGRSLELQQYLERRVAEQQIEHVFAGGRAALDRLYHEPLPPARMRERKHETMIAIGEAVRSIEGRYGMHTGYDAWIQAGLNNAHLASIATYSDCVPGFERLLEREGGRLPDFYAAVRKLGRDRSARQELCRQGAAAAETLTAITAPAVTAVTSGPATKAPRP